MLQQVNFNSNAYSSAIANKVSKSTKPAETEKTTELTEAEKLESFKKEVWKEIDSMPWNRSGSWSIHITDDAFKKMMEDSAFRNEMMSLLHENARASSGPQSALFSGAHGMFNISTDGCSGTTYPPKNSVGMDEFEEHSKDPFWVNRANKNDEHIKSWQEKMLEHRLMLEERVRKEITSKEYKNPLEKGELNQRKETVILYDNYAYNPYL